MNRRQYLLTVTAALAGCGGGSSAPAPVVGLWGDSLASGQLATAEGAPPQFLPTLPALALQAALGGRAAVAGHGVAGMLPAQALEPIRAAREGITVLWFGGTVAVRYPDYIPQFTGDLLELAYEAPRPVLVGMPHHPDYDRALAQVDKVIRWVAGQVAAPFVDVRAVTAGGIVLGHPDADYSGRMCAAIAATVGAML